MKNINETVVLLTGASSGIGKVTAKQLLEMGYIVYGTARRVEKMADLKEMGAHILAMNVTDDSSMVEGVNHISKEHGGASGIGLGIAKALANAGTHIVVADIQEDKALEAATELTKLGVKTSTFKCDVTDRSSVEKLAKHAWAEFGHVDIIVNNAGVMIEGCPLIDGKESDFRWQLDVNLIGEWNGCAVFGKRFIEQGTPAHIINTASENSFYAAVPNSGFYVATKHAVLGMSDALRLEMPEFVNVSILACGMVNTSLGFAGEVRPEKFGGPVVLDQVTRETVKQVMGLGMDADEIGRLTVEGIQRGDFYIVTHPHNRAYIAERYEEILRAYDTYAPNFEGDDKYDVRKIMARLMENN